MHKVSDKTIHPLYESCHMTSLNPIRRNRDFLEGLLDNLFEKFSKSRNRICRNVENQYINAALQIQNHIFREFLYSKSQSLHQKLSNNCLILARAYRILIPCQITTLGSIVSELFGKFGIFRETEMERING